MAAEQQSTKAASSSSRFALTCGLLRQYMKDHQGGNGAAARLAPAMAMSLMPGAIEGGGAAATAPAPEKEDEGTTVLELFPQKAGTLKKDLATSGSNNKDHPADAERKAPLTIFYGGRMVVFDDFPADKADELMKAAGSRNVVVAPPPAAGQPCLPDMPIARKVSLQRFLAKRKNRIATTDPAASEEESNKRVKEDGAPPCLGGGVNPMLSLS